jgi:hypothetical protein
MHNISIQKNNSSKSGDFGPFFQKKILCMSHTVYSFVARMWKKCWWWVLVLKN